MENETKEAGERIVVEKKMWVVPDMEIISDNHIQSGVAGAYEASHPKFPAQSILAVS